MAKKEVFICDYCNRQSPSFREGSGLPYQHGWRTLTGFEFKASPQYKHEIILKHFCSNQCMFAFIQVFVSEQEQALLTQVPDSSSESNLIYEPIVNK